MTLSTAAILLLLAKVTLVLGLGVTAAALARRKGAAIRHAIWAMALAGTLFVPFAMAGAPAWRLPVLPPPRTALYGEPSIAEHPSAAAPHETTNQTIPRFAPTSPRRDVDHGATISSPPLSTPKTSVLTWLFRVWLLGVAIGLGRLALGHFGLRRIQRAAKPVTADAWQTMLLEERARAGVTRPVSLLASPVVGTPVTWGARRPIILLPATAHTWPHAQQRVALQHELAHIARGDAVTQFWAALARAVYWFHPAVWFAAYRLRLEGEQACDERVVSLGTSPTEYAMQLIELARSARLMTMPTMTSVAMARPSQLEQRLRTILFADRRAFDRRGAIATSMLVALLVVPIAVLQPIARESTRHAQDVEPPAVTEAPAYSPSVPPVDVVPASAPSIPREIDDGALSSLSDPCDSTSAPNEVTIMRADDNDRGWSLTGTDGRCVMTIRLKGQFKLTDDGKDLASLSPNGSLSVQQQDDRTTRKIEITSDASGTLTRTWSVNDSSRPYNEEARERLASVLTRYFKQDGPSVTIGSIGSVQDTALMRQAQALQQQAEAFQRQAETLQQQADALQRRADALQARADAVQGQTDAIYAREYPVSATPSVQGWYTDTTAAMIAPAPAPADWAAPAAPPVYLPSAVPAPVPAVDAAPAPEPLAPNETPAPPPPPATPQR